MKSIPQTILLSGPAGSGKNAIADALTREYGYVQVGLADALKRFCKTMFRVDPQLMWGESRLRETKIHPITLDTCLSHHGVQFGDSINARGPSVGTIRYLNEVMRRQDADDRGAWEHFERVIRAHEPIDTPRRLLQIVGTEWGRGLDDLIWCRTALSVINACHEGYTYGPNVGIFGNYARQYNRRPVVVTDCRFLNELQFFRAHADGIVIWVDDSVRNPNRPKPTHASEPTRESMGTNVHYVFDNNGPLEAMESEIRSPWFQALIMERQLDGKVIPTERESDVPNQHS